jgi:phosphoglycolate phosphatase
MIVPDYPCDENLFDKELDVDKKGVIFDLDGTLVDTIGDIAAAANHALSAYGYPTHRAEKYHAMVGNGLRKTMERALPEGAALGQGLLDAMISYYRSHPADQALAYDGIGELLQKLGDDGVRVSVLSNKDHELTLRIVQELFAGYPFVSVLGMGAGYPPKPDQASASAQIEAMGLTKERVLFVGDTEVDYRTARAVAAEPILVGWGFRSHAVLEQAAPEALIVTSIAQLYDRIEMK